MRSPGVLLWGSPALRCGQPPHDGRLTAHPGLEQDDEQDDDDDECADTDVHVGPLTPARADLMRAAAKNV
jgi:hypothetical protein